MELFVVIQLWCHGHPQIQQQEFNRNASQSWGILAVCY